ncbi:MAG: hypothetical protein M3323_01250 [Actinomycetota bacterium]|nr:hypothetical protein [Actinomycetota bacterium]
MTIGGELLSLTRVVTNANELKPGGLLTIDVIPGNPVAGADLLGAAQLLPLRVGYSIQRRVPDGMGGTRMEDWTGQTARVPTKPSDDDVIAYGDLLHVAFLLVPPLDFGSGVPPAEYVVTVTLFVKGPDLTRTIEIPVKVPPIRIPALAIFSSGPRFEPFTDGEPNAILVQTADLDLPGLEELLDTYNTVLSTLGAVVDAVGFLSFLLAPLKLVTAIVSKVPFPPNVAIGPASDWTELPADSPRIWGNGFDDENNSLLLLGPTDLGMRVFDTTEGSSIFGEEEADLWPVDLQNIVAGDTEVAKYVREELAATLDVFGLPSELPDVDRPADPLGFGFLIIGDWDPDVYDGFTQERKDALKSLFFYSGDDAVHEDVESSFWIQ